MSDYVRALREKVGHDLLFWPSAACLIRDEQDRILLVRHVEGRWTFPAGAVDPGERPADAARRETWEEAGVLVEPLRIAGVFGGGPDFQGTYSNGDAVAWVTTLFEARLQSGEPAPHDDETADVLWASPDEAFALDLSPSTRHMLARVLEGRTFDEATWTP
jgi:8-oxo-dGTP pyrophosphatase MutT (NUDIX family)